MMNGIRSDYMVERFDHGPEIKYKRKGGIFISKQEIYLLVALVAVIAVISGMIGRYSANKNCRVATRLITRAHRKELEEFNLIRTATARLDSAVWPIHYSIELRPVLEANFPGAFNFTVEGIVKIMLEVRRDVNQIKLYGKNIFLKQETILITHDNSQNGTSIDEYINVKSLEYNIERDIVNFHLNATLKAGQVYELSISFMNGIQETPRGLFRIKYSDHLTGQDKWMLATRFDPIYARLAVPCFDEPKFKSTFQLKVLRMKNARAISNTKVNSTTDSDISDYVWDEFGVSPRMSTNSLGLMVLEASAGCHSDSGEKQEFNVWSRDTIDCKSTLHDAAKILASLEDYLGMPCPVPKIDIVVAPKYPQMNADIWGLIVLPERDTTQQVQNSTIRHQQMKFSLAEKLAHQWFGTLVTTSQWAESWINEALANYLPYLTLRSVEPEWDLVSRFHTHTLYRALHIDSDNSTSVGLNNTMISTASYDALDPLASFKGACILRMLNMILPDAAFQNGIKSYLSTKQYNVTELDDFWSSIENQINETEVKQIFEKNQSVRDFMRPWITNPGYPVLTVTRNHTKNSVLLSQKKFSLSQENSSDTWSIPITYTKKSEGNFADLSPKFWLNEGQVEAERTNITFGETEWVLFNLNHSGFYRTNYDVENWGLLAEDFLQLPATTQAQLMNDAFALARAELLNITVALNLTPKMQKNKNYVTWLAFLDNIKFIKSLIEDTESYEAFQEYLKALILPNYLQLTKFTDSELPQTDVLLRSKLTAWACSLEITDCVNKSLDEFNHWVLIPDAENSTIPIDSDYQDTVICTALRSSTSALRQSNWKFLWDYFRKCHLASDRARVLRNLMCTPEPRLIKMMLDKTFSNETFLQDEELNVLWDSVSFRYHTVDVAFDYVREKWDLIFEKTNGTRNSLQETILTSVTKGLNSELHLRDLLDFQETYAANLSDAAVAAIQDGIDEVRRRTEWRATNLNTITNWLNKDSKQT
nr:PREDICTED: aminopeptidase N-like [Bemisia tabaci]